jgi:tetratricopeptide (TPR) repeat protein
MGLFDFWKRPAARPADEGVPATPAPAPDQGAGGKDASDDPTLVQRAPQPPAAAAERTPPAFVEARDALGRPVRIPRDEYAGKVLPGLLQAHAANPDRLAAVILQAVRDGFAADVLPAANRLTAIDKDLERALSVLALVQRDVGELDQAEATLRELQQKRPGSLAATVGLGMLAIERGQTARAEGLFWDVLQRDCNHADAVHGWLRLRHQAVGDAGYRAEVGKLAALPGSWRAQLWLARHLAQQGAVADAVAIHRDVLTRCGEQPDAVLMAGTDLVQQQQHDLVRELVLPRFVPGRSHPHLGLALLHHHLQNREHEAGAALLHQMHLHYGHQVGNELRPFTAAFDQLRLAALPPVPAPTGTPRLFLYRLDRPIWCAGLEDPTWLLPPRPPAARSVLFFGLAVDGQPGLAPGREEEIGRLTRSVPLFLAEQAWLGSPHRGAAVLPLAEQGGWALLGRPWPEEQLLQQVPAAERAQALLVTGVLRVDGEQRRIDLWVYDGGRRQRVGHAAAEGGSGEIGRLLLQLLAELWPILGGPAGHRPPVGDEPFWARYAEGLAQHAALVVTQAGGLPRERLYGERYIVQWLQDAALAETRWQPGFWTLASALGVLHQLGSPIPREHARFVAELFRQSPANSAFARLAVRPLRACGLEALWQARRAEIVAAAGADPAYAAWLERAEASR